MEKGANGGYEDKIKIPLPDVVTFTEKIPQLDLLESRLPGVNLENFVDQEGVLKGDINIVGSPSSAELSDLIPQFFSRITDKADFNNLGPDDKVEIKSQMRDILKRLEGGVVVDLGAGRLSTICDLVKNLKVSAYIGVEPVHYLNLKDSLNHSRKQTGNKGVEMSVFIVAENMLSFLKRLPDNSASIITSNIDFDIIGNSKLAKEVGEEIDRVIGSKNLYITNFSQIPLPQGKTYKIFNFATIDFKGELAGKNGDAFELPQMAVVIKE